ncbi:hypothetical protein ACFQU1_19620 [Chelatococcus sp. GCM10030263]|uniref:hypothetical protein n=1 Tax=Chelatococcus sp. GCM10030263 TaxID=3273387 RepID=UPI00360C66CC
MTSAASESAVAPLGSMLIGAILLGIGQSGIFGLALRVIVLRSPDSHVAARPQHGPVGYRLAAASPLLTGLLHDRTGAWDSVAVLYLVVTIVGMACGLGAARPRHVAVTAERAD